MSDEIRRWSDELARDPSSLVFLQLGESLRRRGQLDFALKVAMRGLERHSHLPDAHDLLARIAVDRGELERAFDEWDMLLRLRPGDVGALKGMGFVCFRQGRLADAERYLGEAAVLSPDDQSITTALEHIRPQLAQQQAPGSAATPGQEAADRARRAEGEGRNDGSTTASGGRANGTSNTTGANVSRPAAEPSSREQEASAVRGNPRMLFADIIGDREQTALLLDSAGFVLAGAYVAPDGRDVAQEVGAELSGVSEEANRAMRHLELGEWTSISFETEAAIVAMAPAPENGLLMVAASRETPLGLVSRFRDEASARVRRWLESMK